MALNDSLYGTQTSTDRSNNKPTYLQFFYNQNTDNTRQRWIPYPSNINEILCECIEQVQDEKIKTKHTSADLGASTKLKAVALDLQVGDAIFTVDLEAMVQINQTTNTRHAVCFLERPVDYADKAFEASELDATSAVGGTKAPRVSFDDYHSTWANLATTKSGSVVKVKSPKGFSTASPQFISYQTNQSHSMPQRMWCPSQSLRPQKRLIETVRVEQQPSYSPELEEGGDLLDFVNQLDEDLI